MVQIYKVYLPPSSLTSIFPAVSSSFTFCLYISWPTGGSKANLHPPRFPLPLRLLQSSQHKPQPYELRAMFSKILSFTNVPASTPPLESAIAPITAFKHSIATFACPDPSRFVGYKLIISTILVSTYPANPAIELSLCETHISRLPPHDTLYPHHLRNLP